MPHRVPLGNLQKKYSVSKRHDLTGCWTSTPVFVLEPSLQQGHKIQKWKPRARQAIYLGHSPRHAQTVPLVLNINTGLCSTQYHVVFDDHFTTTQCRQTNKLPHMRSDLFTHNRVIALEHAGPISLFSLQHPVFSL
jgi:hypothetical protein